MNQFVSGFLFTAGSIAAMLCVLAIAAFCEFVSKLLETRGREDISNAIVSHAASICGLAERRSEFE